MRYIHIKPLSFFFLNAIEDSSVLLFDVQCPWHEISDLQARIKLFLSCELNSGSVPLSFPLSKSIKNKIFFMVSMFPLLD